MGNLRVGVTLYIQNHDDWPRYLAAERGEPTDPVDPASDSRLIAEELDSGLLAEELGFDSLWAVEHHVSPYTMIPNPVQLLTFFAGATSRVDLGTMVVVLPWHHPLRVAEDIIMLQHLLRGRTPYIGFGRGAARREFNQLGIDMNESKERFAESIEIIKLALSHERFSYQGQYYKFDDVTIRPRPLDAGRLLDNLQFSWGSPQSAPIGAAHGLRPMIIPQRAWQDYHGELAEFSRARAQAGFAPVRPRIHFNMFCAPTPELAKEGADKWYRQASDSALWNYELTGDHFVKTRGYEHYAETRSGITRESMQELRLAGHPWGTPDQVLERMLKIADDFHPEEFMLVFRGGGMPKEVADESMRLFAKEVLPALQATELKPPITYTDAA